MSKYVFSPFSVFLFIYFSFVFLCEFILHYTIMLSMQIISNRWLLFRLFVYLIKLKTYIFLLFHASIGHQFMKHKLRKTKNQSTFVSKQVCIKTYHKWRAFFSKNVPFFRNRRRFTIEQLYPLLYGIIISTLKIKTPKRKGIVLTLKVYVAKSPFTN